MTERPNIPEAYELIRGLRAVRNYLPEPLSADEIDLILEAGRWTGSSKNTQRWAFIPLRDANARSAVADCGNFSKPLRDAPFGIALVRLPEGYEFDIGRVAQTMMLAADALGIGSCPVTLHDETCATKALRLPPDHTCRYAIAFGRADTDRERVARTERPYGGRKPLDEIIWEFPGQ